MRERERARTVCEQCLLKVNPLKGNENEIKQGWSDENRANRESARMLLLQRIPHGFHWPDIDTIPTKHGKTINCCAACSVSVLRLLCIWNDYFLERTCELGGGEGNNTEIIQQIVREPATWDWELLKGNAQENAKSEIWNLMKIARKMAKIKENKGKELQL